MTESKYEIIDTYAEVRASGIHHKGVFAIKHIPKGATVMKYTGRLISKEEGDLIEELAMQKFLNNPETNAATYMFELTPEKYLDGDIEENDAKYINHSCEPNCEVEIDEDCVWIVALRDIKIGEELSFNYGFDINDTKPYDFKHHVCRCGSSRCVGYILDEEEWPKMKELLAKESSQ